MSLNDINDNKPTYGTVPAASGATKGSRRGVVVGLAAAACFLLGVAAANVVPTQGLRGTALYAKYYDNEDGIDNISVGDVPDGGCVGGPCGAGGAYREPHRPHRYAQDRPHRDRQPERHFRPVGLGLRP